MSDPTDPYDPTALLRLVRQADRLEALPRTGYLISRVPLPESIAAHSYGVALVALLLADAVSRRLAPSTVDRATVLTMALIHDIQESLTTDVPSPVKGALGREIFAVAERRAAHALLGAFGDQYTPIWDEYEQGTSLEARIVRAADRIQMFVKVLQYERAGLGDTERFWGHPESLHDHAIPEARVILDRLVEHHVNGDWPSEDTDLKAPSPGQT